ncbi:MAG TPA: hypothetical protein VE397_11345 [Stellaceae bacterium]|nr:hypothetical protein [Stellaceae bacterium]
MTRIRRLAAFGLGALMLAAGPAAPQPSAGPSAAQQTFMLTIFLRHDQSKTLGQIQQHLKETGFDQSFPPPGIEIVSWYVMMGIGQVVTLRVPPARLREVNRVIEEKGWGAYRTDFYPTYDYLPVWKAAHPGR